MNAGSELNRRESACLECAQFCPVSGRVIPGKRVEANSHVGHVGQLTNMTNMDETLEK